MHLQQTKEIVVSQAALSIISIISQMLLKPIYEKREL